MKGILSGLTESGAATDPASPDARLVGRTYAIPFDSVWNASMRLADGEMRGWSVMSADDLAGVIVATKKALLFGQGDDVKIDIGLDENAQTRVDVVSGSHSRRPDLRRNRRAIGRFFRKLDRSLEARPEQILDATRVPAWIESK
ncbi:MAG: DUF1499 domain-containing protein [Gemmatimonadetes bacterium]|nr:DUF1499 domain-containing protein [Gemmatimonadota bacterium]